MAVSMTASAGTTQERATRPLVASVRDLRVHFESKAGVVHAVDGVTFEIRDGETLGLVGETGCGKSVTARSFIRLVPTPPGIYAGGEIDFWSTEARQANDEPIDLLQISDRDMLEIRGDRIAMIFQDPGKALNPALSIRSQIAEVFYQHRSEEILEALGPKVPLLIRRAARQQTNAFERFLLKIPPLRSKAARMRAVVDDLVAQALTETQIPSPRKIMDSYPHELSGGMKQRVLIAQALACNPDLLIADEPTTALDVTIQAQILKLLKDLQAELGMAVLLITHDLGVVANMAEEVVVMYRGQVMELNENSQPFSMGRDAGNSLVIDAEWVSRTHAMIEFKKGYFVISDRSTNASYVKLGDDDELRLHRDEVHLRKSGAISLGQAIGLNQQDIVYFQCSY